MIIKLQHRILREYPYNRNEVALKIFSKIFFFTLPRPYHYYIKFYKWADIEKKKMRFVTWWFGLFPGKYCWADCVTWAFSPKRYNPFNIDTSKGCEEESKTHEHESCYCGNWNAGKCWDKYSKAEQKAITDEIDKQRAEQPDDIPF